jgi:hypothetical protein
MTWADAAYGAAVLVGALAGTWLLSVAVEAGLWLDPAGRTALALAVLTVALGVGAAYLARPLGRLLGIVSSPDAEDVARTIGRHYPEVSDRLVNLLQLAEGRRTHAPDPLVDRAVQRLGSEVETVDFEEVETFERARRAARLASLPVVGVLVFLLVSPSTFLGASERLLAPTEPFTRPAPFSLTVTPGDARLVKGDSLEIRVRAAGTTTPGTATLALQPVGQTGTETLTLQPGASGTFRHTISGVREPMRYRVEAGPVTTNWYDVRVAARPLVRSLQVRVDPPAYTGLPERSLDANVGDVTGLPGSTVEVEATLGGPPVDRAALVFDDSTRVPLEVSGGADGPAVGRAAFTLDREGSYRVRLVSDAGIANRAPIRYRTALRADARPTVSFLAPEPEAPIDDDLAAQLRLRLSDDFGFSQMRLYYRVAEKRFGRADSAFSSIEIPIDAPRRLDQEVAYDWLLAQDSGLDLMPGDAVRYFVRVWDNDAVAGYKAAETARQTLRFASLAEQYDRLGKEQDEAEGQIRRLNDQADQLDRQFRELREELRRQRSADWEDKRQLDQIQKKQQSIQQGVQKLSKQVEQMTRQMQQENLTSPEISRKYEELQRVIEEINSPELNKALEKLRQAMDQMDLRQMQQAMEDVDFNEKQYQERLKRTLDLFKQIRQQQQLDEMARRTGELKELQERLEQETAKRLQDSTRAAPNANRPQEKPPGAEQPDGEQPDGEQPDGEQPGGERPGAEESPKHPAADSSGRAPRPDAPARDSLGRDGARSGAQPDSAARRPTRPRPDSAGRGPNSDLAREQQRSRKRMKELMQQMQQLSDEMEQTRSSPRRQMQQLNRQMQQQNLPRQMQKNSRQLRRNQLQKARQGQRQMQQQLQQMQQRLSKMKQNMQGQQQQINMAGLRDALSNTLRLSQRQESLRQTVGSLSGSGPTVREYAPRQEDLASGLKSVSDSLQQLARRIPQMSRSVQKETGDALRAMNDATNALSEENPGQATGYQKGSMKNLNELALLLSNLLDQMQSGQGGGGSMSMQQMLQKLQKMSGQQQKLNQQIQKMLDQAQGERLSSDEQKRLQQLSRQQSRLRRQLQQVNEESKRSGVQDQILGDLEKIAEQMQKTIDELDSGSQDRRTLERQRNILTRLLQAQRSMRTQGKEQKRRGRSADEVGPREGPEELSPQEQADRMRRDLIRALESGYAPDYEELIKRYFELLQEQRSGAPPRSPSGGADAPNPSGAG